MQWMVEEVLGKLGSSLPPLLVSEPPPHLPCILNYEQELMLVLLLKVAASATAKGY